MTSATKASELRAGWPILLGAFLGLSVGVTSTIGYSYGALVTPLEADFGWSRASLSLGLTFYAVGVFATGPWWGMLADRFGARGVATVSLLLYGGLLFGMPWLVPRAPFWLLYLLAGGIGSGTGAVTLLKPVADRFSIARGIAIGIVFASIGLSAFWVPRLAVWLIGIGSWMLVYKVFAGFAFAAIPIVWLCLPGRNALPSADAAQPGESSREGLSITEAARTISFWLLMAIGLSLTIGLIGLASHLIPMFHQSGASLGEAAARASMLGLSSLGGRLVVGLVLDRTRGPVVAVIVAALATAGLLLLLAGAGSPVLSLIAVLLIGFAFGSEMDMIAYFASRYFGRRAFGAIYGWLGGVIAMGGGCGALIAGAAYDHYGDYSVAILICAALTGLATLLAMLLGPYRFAAD
ncbi:MFS transporter [Sphingomonas naphthae]|uniref:MFS transporter n=1 Tax=Sphingomonas naphthae TaxID=1813468 RepID=A0ABY7TMS7_9SPHN|nr:MFS transporter [Sphingomonas naphthae]WCT74525.1 MFS transporter [Sphingomonas naphthae]